MRIASIDILRALTMVLMIWVNDFWTLTNVPKWLQHASATEDYLGFSDVIFPLFLFIVGLSIPYAIQHRLSKNEGTASIGKHILIRSFSLLLIGFFMVNYETHSETLGLGKYLWCLLMALAVVLVWMNWNKSPVPKTWHVVFQLAGLLIFVYLAIAYKGGDSGEIRMKPQWWGILGLIGWAYFANALVYLFAKGNFYAMLFLWLLFNVLSVLSTSTNLLQFQGVLSHISPLYSGTIPAFTSAGVVATLLFKRLSNGDFKWSYIILITLGVLCLSYGFFTRPIWGISKIQGTPSWLAICTGVGFLSFVLLHYVADVLKVTRWAVPIAPAGTATLTCYMIPYFVYPLLNITDFRLPQLLNSGSLGLITSFSFALLVVFFVGWIERKGFKLKL
ncbi:heparan-alpha-glucosaminide N-acetyltransferase domain-containing protein [Flagellimonas pacifica]|uniref:Predicted acyltransferase n=1 Tax=Flagellimonas pacifica TaxID=1247520 RepID=A0A285MVI4_9FLAO|nr:heparan-alpha-glucosaminide N-acetyltransferase domain-containing protein [Allomuricauda parva]SNY99806.1 Predicted acyltransferase [Allomuricauda parva]